MVLEDPSITAQRFQQVQQLVYLAIRGIRYRESNRDQLDSNNLDELEGSPRQLKRRSNAAAWGPSASARR